jgi:RNA polymerase sigma factor (sigma-70 family)
MNFNPSNNIDEQLLWQNFIAGDTNAYAQLYNIYADKMYSYGCTITLDHELVKDCMMDIFVDIYDKRKDLKHVRNVRIFLLVSLKNRLIDKIRKNAKEELTDNFTIHKTTGISVEEMFIYLEEKNEIRKKINSLLETLSVRQREVIYFRYVEELPFEQIAGIMDMNYQSVRNLLHRTIRNMREKLPNSPHS